MHYYFKWCIVSLPKLIMFCCKVNFGYNVLSYGTYEFWVVPDAKM
jgi:hypothetical protein